MNSLIPDPPDVLADDAGLVPRLYLPSNFCYRFGAEGIKRRSHNVVILRPEADQPRVIRNNLVPRSFQPGTVNLPSHFDANHDESLLLPNKNANLLASVPQRK